VSRPASITRVLLALLVSLLVVVESAGVARAIGLGSTVSCCCGRHSIARPCNCLRCPSKLRHAEAHHDHGATVVALGQCTPSTEEGALLVVATVVAAPSLPVPVALGELTRLAIAAPRSVQPEPARPPP